MPSINKLQISAFLAAKLVNWQGFSSKIDHHTILCSIIGQDYYAWTSQRCPAVGDGTRVKLAVPLGMNMLPDPL